VEPGASGSNGGARVEQNSLAQAILWAALPSHLPNGRAMDRPGQTTHRVKQWLLGFYQPVQADFNREQGREEQGCAS